MARRSRQHRHVRGAGPGQDAGEARIGCDFDRDGAVGGRDLGALIGAWGSQDPLFDLDRNGIVAGGDLAILLSNWSSR